MATKDPLEQVVNIREVNISEYSMFMPRGVNSLKRDYPELSSIDEFKRLSPYELLFCWFYAFEMSPFYELESPRQKTMFCYRYAFVKTNCKSKPNEDKYMSGQFPEYMKEAIGVMESFRIKPRIRALRFMEKQWNHYDQLIDTDSNGIEFTDKDGKVDHSKKKAFIETINKAGEMIPILNSRIEQGYSVKTVKSLREEAEDTSFIDDYMDSKD